jgi:hypothetical protein
MKENSLTHMATIILVHIEYRGGGLGLLGINSVIINSVTYKLCYVQIL